MNFIRRNLFFLIISLIFTADITPDKAFKIANVTDKITKIVFEVPEVEILNDGEGFSKFNTGDMIGITIEEGIDKMINHKDFLKDASVNYLATNYIY